MKVKKEMLQRAMEEVMEEDLDRIRRTCGGEELERQIKDSMQETDWEKLYQKAQKTGKYRASQWIKAAVISLAVLAAASVTAYAIERVRQAAVLWEVKQGNNEDGFRFKADNPAETASPAGAQEEAPTRIERRYQPSYIADGFREYGEDWQKASYKIVYEKDGGLLNFKQLVKTTAATSDLMMSQQEDIRINGYEGEMGLLGTERMLRFITGKYVFQLYTDEPVAWDELIRMAESVSMMAPDIIEDYYEPSYLPEGYELWDEEGTVVTKVMTDKTYVKQKNGSIISSISFSQMVLKASISINSEDMTRETVDINGWKGQLNYKKDRISLIWATNEYAFTVHGYGKITKKELLKVARSVEPAE